MDNKEQKCVLQVCAYAAPYAGNFIQTLRVLASECEKNGLKTIFVFPETAKGLTWTMELEKIYTIYFLPLHRARISLETYRKMREIYREHNVMIAHSHFELYDMPVSLMAPKQTKVFWHLHDALDLIYEKSGPVYRALWKMQYALASKNATLLSVSEKGKKFAVELGFNKKNAFFVPNGIDTDRIDRKCDKNDAQYQYDFLLFGWDYYRKGVDVLLNAARDMKSMDYRCAIVTEEELPKTNGFTQYKQLIHQPPVSDVAELYRGTKCFLHISRHEGLSYALLEAIYAGCIVICSDIDQNMFAKQFPTVHFVPVGDHDALRRTMESVMNGKIINSKEALRVSRTLIQDEYSLNSWVNRTMEFYFG